MKLTLETIFNGHKALGALAQKDLSITTSFKVAKLIKAVDAELETFNAQRTKILESVGATLNEDGSQYNIPENKRLEFANKLNELLSIEVEVPDKLDISGENISIAPGLLLDLDPFITM